MSRPHSMPLSRRRFLALSGAAAFLTAAAVPATPGLRFTTGAIELVPVKLSLAGLAREFDDYRIGFLTDIHYGEFIPDEWVDQAIRLLEGAKIDLLLLGGDFINIPDTLVSSIVGITRNPQFLHSAARRPYRRIYGRLATILAQVRPPDGSAAVYGNHDRWHAPKICARLLAHSGIKLLVNDSLLVQRGRAALRIIGCDDYWTGIPDLTRFPAGAATETRILLAHNPDFISETIERTDFDFQLGLAGHTHGGQIKLPGLGVLHHNIRDQRFSCGLYPHPRAPVYTSRGLGVVEIPYRINCPPEVTVITLKS